MGSPCVKGLLGLYSSWLAVLYGSGASGLTKVCREVAEEWLSSWCSRLLGAGSHGPEDSDSREYGWENGSILL